MNREIGLRNVIRNGALFIKKTMLEVTFMRREILPCLGTKYLRHTAHPDGHEARTHGDTCTFVGIGLSSFQKVNDGRICVHATVHVLCLTTKYSMQADCFTNRRDWRYPNSEDRIDLAPSLQSWAAVKLVMRHLFFFFNKNNNYFTYAKLFASCGCFKTEVSTCIRRQSYRTVVRKEVPDFFFLSQFSSESLGKHIVSSLIQSTLSLT